MHHTKTKADIGLGKTIADIVSKGYTPCIPLSEHQPYDLLVVLTKHYKEKDFDYYAIYCPEKEQVIYVPNTLDCPKVVRFEKPANNQKKYVKWAKAYLELEGESSETIRHTPEMVKT